LWLAASKAFFTPRVAGVVIEAVVRPPLSMFGMSRPIFFGSDETCGTPIKPYRHFLKIKMSHC
jgi:hypothetical protein